MKKFKLILILNLFLMILISCASGKKDKDFLISSDNWNTDYTFVFVHGLGGWGQETFKEHFCSYWGLTGGSLLKKLNKKGYDCCSATVSSYGSVWDRTCELYAQLTGTVVDYGVEHSARCGHKRFGKDYSKHRLVQQWSSENKLNFIGHSMGGNTIRMLANLMEFGFSAEIECTPADDISPLFTGGKGDWIYSITTLATPHNGTSAISLEDPHPEEQKLAEKMIRKNVDKIKNNGNGIDSCEYDLKIPNALKTNEWLEIVPEVYYFSYACKATEESKEGTQVANPKIIESPYIRNSNLMGSFVGTTSDGVVLTKEWWPNDGLVNTISASAPFDEPSVEFNPDDIRKGVWNVMPFIIGDHMSVQGGITIKKDVVPLYSEIIERINKL